VFPRALHWSLSWAKSIQSTPSHPISLRSILILSTLFWNERGVLLEHYTPRGNTHI
jgi:hypothetical protein